MLTDSQEYIRQIGVRVDVMQTTGRDQTLDDADVFSPKFRPTE